MDILIFLYLVLFPFGKLTGALPDIIIAFVCLLYLIKKRRFEANKFLVICGLSLIFSLGFFQINEILIGSLYFIRLVFYFVFSRIIFEKYGKNKLAKELIFNSLIIVGFFIALFGYVQYLLFPDLTSLKSIGWDDHYYRLVSTFLDPAFTGILLLLSEILILVKTVEKKSLVNFFLNLFSVFAILLTYSRSTYLAFICVLLFLLFKFRHKFIILILVIFILFIPLLPKPAGEGVNLLRMYSVNQKFINYDKSVEIIKKSPVLGIGFNNVCVATDKQSLSLRDKNFESHSCSGLDNSILFIIATTGVIGLLIFVSFITNIIKQTRRDYVGWALFASFIAIFVHGMFTNTFFYNFILGWLAMLIGISRTKDYM